MTMGPGLKKFLKKHGRYPKGPKERKEAGTMTKKDKARARGKSGSKKPATKKKPKSKSKTSTKSKSKSNGGKKMKSRFNPFNKNGVKIVTLAGLVALLAPAFDRVRGGPSPVDWLLKGEVGVALKDYKNTIMDNGRPYKGILKGAIVVAGVSRVADIKSVSFVQFS